MESLYRQFSLHENRNDSPIFETDPSFREIFLDSVTQPAENEFTTETKQRCANALCVAQGYASGEFLESSENFCERSLSRNTWGFDLGTNNIKNVDGPNGNHFSAKCSYSGMCFNNLI